MNAPQNPYATPNADFAAGEGLLSFANADNTNASADAENPDASTGANTSAGAPACISANSATAHITTTVYMCC